MRLSYSIFILLILMSCRKDQAFVDLSEMEGSSCLYSVFVDSLSKYTKFNDAIMIKATSATFQAQQRVYGRNELEEFRTEKNTFQIPVKEKHFRFLLRDKKNANLLKSYHDGYMICKVEAPIRMQEFTEEELFELGNEISFKSVLTPAKVIMRNIRFDDRIRNDSVMTFKAGYYTPLITAVAGGYESQFDFVFNVQKRLVELGFDVDETGSFDEKSKAAITKFQRMNDLREDALDIQFFECLGFEY